MGNEFAPLSSGDTTRNSNVHVTVSAPERCSTFFRDLNHFTGENFLWEVDRSWDGFKWLDPDDRENSVFSTLESMLMEARSSSLFSI